jgi:3-deoxy-D-manno-octulosonic-acid transferase
VARREDRIVIGGVAFFLYQGVLALVMPCAILFLFIARRGELRERLGGGAAKDTAPIWIHAASLGEFEAALPLVRRWNAGGLPVLVSCTNRTARARIAERVPQGVRVRIAPLDFLPFLARAMDRERPSRLVFVETEIWPAWLVLARNRGIDVAFVSARISERSYPRYRSIRFLMRSLLRSIRAIGCRTEEDRLRWIGIGAPADVCHVWGNTKYSLGESGELPPRAQGDRPLVLIGGSVRPGEEALLDVVSGFEPGGIRLVVVPRHLREVDAWERGCYKKAIACRRISLAGIDASGPPEILARVLRENGGALPAVLVVDRIGVLRALYKAGDAAFVGGTWIPLGGHNLFEPAREGIPVFFGPSIGGVRDAADAIRAHGGGDFVDSAERFTEALRILAKDPRHLDQTRQGARRAAESLAGGVQRTLEGLGRAGFPVPGER